LESDTKNGVIEIMVRVKDSGSGYAFDVPHQTTELINSGRGLQLIHNLSKSIRIEAPGNMIEAVLV
jgi:hypothetical protein